MPPYIVYPQTETRAKMPTEKCCWVLLLVASALAQNPSILEDARVHPTSDGTFGFLYRTQDGISHAAKGAPGGAVQGRFTYTDPTGLKVNFNYNAGAQAVKQAQQEPQQQQYQPPPPPPQPQPQPQPQPRYQEPDRYTQAQYQPEYQPRQDYQPRYQPPPQQQQYQPRPQQYRPRPPVRNDIYDYEYENQRYRQ